MIGAEAETVAALLLNRYGSIGRLFSISEEGLAAALHDFPQAAEALSAARRLISVALEQQLLTETVAVTDRRLLSYLTFKLRNPDEERLFAIFLNAAGCFLHGEQITSGSRSTLTFSCRSIIQRALDLGTDGILIAHNHLSGNCQPSPQDRHATAQLQSVAAAMEIALIDHLIIGASGTYSMKLEKML